MDKAKKSRSQELTSILQVPNVILPTDIESMDHDLLEARLHRGDGNNSQSSLRSSRRPPSRQRICRHLSDSESRKENGELSVPRRVRPRTKKVRRSISAIETKQSRYRPRVRRSISDRSGLIMAGKHLLPPRSRPQSVSDKHSSRCSSTKTLSSNVSIPDIVAVEFGLKDIPGLTPKEARRRRVVCTVMAVSITILVLSIILVAVTLFLSPAVDEIRKCNHLCFFHH
ncbi:uncharacterized protein [Parasteatoda tepidariorum]|uniref:uncharacterized protein n=1 Tax=Parasteatoda tepidariorum TaxID=114398 RepID=UPI000A2C098A